MVVINESGLQSLRPFRTSAERRYMCIFEYVYFARPDASFDGISVYDARKRMGRALWEDQPVEADIVVPVPDSGVAAALGYAEAAGLPFELGLIRSHYVGRTFIEPCPVDSTLRRSPQAAPGAESAGRGSASSSSTIRSFAARPAARS